MPTGRAHAPSSSPQSDAPEASTVLCDAEELRLFTTDVLTRLGTPQPDAVDMAEQVVGSELAGHESHGLRRLPEYVERTERGIAVPASTGRISIDRGALVRIDGDGGFGHVVIGRAMRLAVERARRHGIAAVAVRGSEAAGRFADFCEYAARQGMATLVFVNYGGAGQSATPPGGAEARMSTNPIAFGIPRSQPPHLVLDMATSAVALGHVSEWQDRGEPIPPEWATPEGVLRFFGGAKGFGLALIAEALAGALGDAGTVSSEPGEERQGVLIIAIDIEGLRPLDEFTSEVDEFLAYVRSVKLEPGAKAVRIPGESSALTTQRRTSSGAPLQSFTWERMRAISERYGVPLPTPLTQQASAE